MRETCSVHSSMQPAACDAINWAKRKMMFTHVDWSISNESFGISRGFSSNRLAMVGKSAQISACQIISHQFNARLMEIANTPSSLPHVYLRGVPIAPWAMAVIVIDWLGNKYAQASWNKYPQPKPSQTHFLLRISEWSGLLLSCLLFWRKKIDWLGN